MLDINQIIKEYNDGKSIREIADMYQTYPNKIARLIKKAGAELRSKEDAAKLAIDRGKLTPPMQGKKRTQAEKDNISVKRSERWKSMNEEDLEAFKKSARDRWELQTEDEKNYRQSKAGKALRKASTEGSKAEKFLYEHLTKLGYDVIIHKVGLIPGEKFEIDLYIPSLRVAIEIDGPQHFLPIYGEQNLRRNIKYDAIKNGALISRGLCVVRIKYLLKHNSQRTNSLLLKLVEEQLQKITHNFPEPQDRLIELEINNE